MICLRCGYCCKTCAVIIVDDPDKGVVEDNIIAHLGDGVTPCKHLLGDEPGKYSCAVHHYPWYKETPCFSHGQIETSDDTPCRMGNYILNGIEV